MSSRAPSYPQIARAQWLLGLDAPESAEEIRRAWKERVARTHPDRNAERAGAATRVTAAFNQARELCEWWLEAGEPWPKPMAPEALRDGRARARRAPARAHAGAEPLVLPRRRPRDATRARARSRRRAGAHGAATGTGEDTRVELDDGSSAAPGDLVPGRLRLPRVRPLQRARRSSAPRCAPVRRASRSSCSWSARIARSSPRCAASARAPAPAARPLPSSATRVSRSSRASASLGRGRRPAAPRGAPRQDARGLRARLRALGRRLDGARRSRASDSL